MPCHRTPRGARVRDARATAPGIRPSLVVLVLLAACGDPRPEPDRPMDTALAADLRLVATALPSDAAAPGRDEAPSTPRRAATAPSPRPDRRAVPPPPARSVAEPAPQRRQADAPARAARAEPAAQVGEPSEREMLAALQDRMDAYNDNMRRTMAACRNREFADDPLLAMQCLGLAGASQGDDRVDFQVAITGFRKLGCEKALGRPGYVCDYVAGVTQNNPALTGTLGQMMRAGEVTQARFVRTDGAWLLIPPD